MTPTAFPAWEDVAAYVVGDLTREQAITEARDCVWQLRDDYTRRDLRVKRVYMAHLTGRAAEEESDGEFDSFWIECARSPNAERWWRVEPRPRDRSSELSANTPESPPSEQESR